MLTPMTTQFCAKSLLRSIRDITLRQDRYDPMLKQDINQPTKSFYYDAWELKPQYNSQQWRDLFAQLGPVGQAKIVAIPPAVCYPAHTDVEDRYHITLQGHMSYLIDLQQDKMYSTTVDNVCYNMDTTKVHTAVNFGYQDRIQLVIRQLLHRTVLNDACQVHIRPRVIDETHDQRLLFDTYILGWLNSANKRRIINNFDPMGKDVEVKFELERSCVAEFRKQVAQCGMDMLCEIT